MSSELQERADEIRAAAGKCRTKPVETFWLDRDPLTGEPEPSPKAPPAPPPEGETWKPLGEEARRIADDLARRRAAE